MPRVIVTDKLRNYGAANKEIMQMSCTGRANGRIIEPKSAISRPVNESGRCVDSNHKARLNDFSPPTGLSAICSESAVTF